MRGNEEKGVGKEEDKDKRESGWGSKWRKEGE